MSRARREWDDGGQPEWIPAMGGDNHCTREKHDDERHEYDEIADREWRKHEGDASKPLRCPVYLRRLHR